ncbi:MAG: outer membrane protein assembly factor BamA, partial [Puniceicoccales bacterium]|nr:outer membrane protein assembly factor BamA [Puniceicoccales bacterium]
MLLIVSLCVVVVCPFQSVSHAADASRSNVVGSIVYECDGDVQINREILEARVQLKEGKEFSPFLADASIKALYASGKFEHVSVKVDEIKGDDGYKVTFSLVPCVIVKDVSFSGNENFKAKALMKQISTKPRSSLSQSAMVSDSEALAKFYNDKGYPYVKISYDVIRDEDPGNVEVVFEIDEGSKFRVGRINFIGNDVVDKKVLLSAMRTKKWTIFSFLKKSGIYRPDEFSADIEILKATFRDYGYLDVEINEDDVTYVSRGKALDISIPVNPGEKYYIGEVSISGNKIYEVGDLDKVLSVQPGDTFSPTQISTSCENIMDFYGRHGYLNTSVQVAKKPDLGTGKINLEFAIDESDKCFVGEIEVRGNSKTKSKVILREMTLAPGDPFDTVRMKDSRTRLMNTGFFSFVDISPIDTKNPLRKNIRVDVKEANTGKVGFGGRIGTGGEVVGFVEFSQSNFDLSSENRVL